MIAHWVDIINVLLNEKRKREKGIYFTTSTALRKYNHRN